MELRFIKVSRSDTTRHHGTLRLFKDARGRVRTEIILDDVHQKDRRSIANKLSDYESRQLTQYPSPVAHALRSPNLWRSSFVHAMVADMFPKNDGYTRLVQESANQHCSQRTWTPVTAIHDALGLLHVGSTSNDESLLHEGKKRYVFVISELRQALSREGPPVSREAILVVSMGLMMSEVLPPGHRCCVPKKRMVARQILCSCISS